MSDIGAAPPIQPKAEKQTRQRSAIAFPYMDLADAMAVATAIHEHVGSGECDEHQLAAWIGRSNKSSTFRILLLGARLFGIIETTGDNFRLTPLGRRAVDPVQARDALAKAFLTVPLYSAVFEKYKGGVMPPASALEREMGQIGVAEKQIRTARLVMERSAEHANFTEHGKDRWVMPGIAPATERSEQPPEDKGKRTGGKNGGSDGELPPLDDLILSLVKKLPPVGTTDWKAADRAMWLQMAAMAFQMVYGAAGHIEIKAVSESPNIPIRGAGNGA